MNICVCIKQVPDTAEIRIDPETHTLLRKGVPSIVNPFDLYALEMALQLKEKKGGKIYILSMGPLQAENSIKSCLEMGADAGYLISGKSFSGSDTYSTSYILSKGIRTVESIENILFDLILCGKQAIDGDTAQVGPEIAEHLKIPQITCVQNLYFDTNILVAEKPSLKGHVLMTTTLPALITILKSNVPPRCPSLKTKLAAKKKVISILTEESLTELDLTKCGLKGSPTKVISTHVVVEKKQGFIIQNKDSRDAINALISKLQDDGVF